MKKVLSAIMAASMVASVATVSAFAASSEVKLKVQSLAKSGTKDIYLVDDDGKIMDKNEVAVPKDGRITIDVNPDKTFYLILDDTIFQEKIVDSGTPEIKERKASASALADKDIFKLKVDKDGAGKSLVSSVKQVADKKIEGKGRQQTIEIKLNDSTMTDEKKAEIDLTLTAKKDKESFINGDKATFKLVLWINNEKVEGDDADRDEGDAFYFSATDNETNTITWGDDKAYLKFSANDDAKDFYAKLSTKANSAIYAEYGDPINADMWFYTFVGNPTIDSTSRAALTLGIPWDDDDDYVPNPSDCFVYEIINDELVDVTKNFTYGDDGDIEGWTTKTRTLGSYVVSDTELDLDAADKEVEVDTDTTSSEGGKEIPNTGSSDMVNVAVVAGVVSLAAAAAVSIKKIAK